MKIIARSGTPHGLEVKEYPNASGAKKYLRDRVNKRREWAARFNRELADRLSSVREEIDGVDVVELKVGTVRHWSAKDDYTNVEFVFELEKEYG